MLIILLSHEINENLSVNICKDNYIKFYLKRKLYNYNTGQVIHRACLIVLSNILTTCSEVILTHGVYIYIYTQYT